MKYDSTLPFDDTLPKEGDFKDDKEFYVQMNDQFSRNSFWSKKADCPLPGNEDTPMKEVRAFYKFWNDFDSWRKFAQHAEHDDDALERADDRYQRRHMENENKKVEKKYVSIEKGRIIKLIEFCYNNDPRIIAETKAIEDEKEAVKKAKRDAFLAEKKKAADELLAAEASKGNSEQQKKEAAAAEAKARNDAARNWKIALKAL